MEILLITILSMFAFVGIASSISQLLRQQKFNFTDQGIKVILYLPHNSSLKLEGIIRNIYSEGIAEGPMANKKIYLIASNDDIDTMKIIEKLKKMYPLEVLPEEVTYCMIKNIDNY